MKERTQFNNIIELKWIYIISLVNNSMVFEKYFQSIYKIKNDFLLIFLHPNPPLIEENCRKSGIRTIYIKYSGKKDFLNAFIKITGILRREKPSIVHTHLFDASLIGLTSAFFLGVKQRIHTRHHGPQHHQYHPHAVKYDKWINFCSTRIIAISANIKNILINLENIAPEKISIVHHGFELTLFDNPGYERINAIRKQYNYDSHRPVIGMISRFTKWKGIQNVIPAFRDFLRAYPEALLVLANASGDYASELNQMLNSLPENSYRTIKFENDSPALFHSFDVFVHVPVDKECEAFGQVYIEALASSKPSVFTLSGVSSEFVDNNIAFVVPFNDSDAILNALMNIFNNLDVALRKAETGYKIVRELFTVEQSVQTTLEAYDIA